MIGMQAFTSGNSQTFTPPSDANSVKITLVGGGGAGGNASGGCAGGGGGGAGGVIVYHGPAALTYTYTVGSGGGPNQNGGSTTVMFSGITLVALGGSAGTTSTSGTGDCAGGAGGLGICNDSPIQNTSNNPVLLGGQTGGPGVATDAAGNVGGNGGSCMFGQGGTMTFANHSGLSGNGFGSGGAGGSAYGGSSSDRNGGNGAGGLVIFEY